jgi:NAD kinase
VPVNADRKVILVTRKTRLEDLIAKYHTLAQARFYVEHLGADFTDYQKEHEAYLAAKRDTVQILERWGRYQTVDRGFLPSFLFGPSDIVVALGQDGLVANTMKYLNDLPLIGVNPDVGRYDGILLPFVPTDLSALLHDVAADKRAFKNVAMAKATLTDGQILYAVNDLFVGPRSHTSAIYEIQFAKRKEIQSSSGLIVSTGLGSTAWIKSIVTGSFAIANAYGAQTGSVAYSPQAWDTSELRFAVREPFPSKHPRPILSSAGSRRARFYAFDPSCRRMASFSAMALKQIASISTLAPKRRLRSLSGRDTWSSDTPTGRMRK